MRYVWIPDGVYYSGLPGEHIQYVDADHRHLCKFESPTSPNYIILQRAFLTTIEELEAYSLFYHSFPWILWWPAD
jgi:hypothetical protein